MEFPVDIPSKLSPIDLEKSAEGYMSFLLYSNPEKADYFLLPNARRIPISLSNVGKVSIFGVNDSVKVLALFTPENKYTAAALYLVDKWWSVEEILKTADSSRQGLLQVRTLREWIVLYVLNRVVYRDTEIGDNDVRFLCHSDSDFAKILWKDGEAIGFYSVKPKGDLCISFLTQRYLLPIMDSVFVRKAHRGNGHGLQILEDFVDSFKDDALGLKYPLSRAMYKVCEQYLNTYPADKDLLWEVASIGGPYERTRVASKIQTMAWKADNDVSMEEAANRDSLNTVEITEEVIIVNRHHRVMEDCGDKPVSTRTRSSEFRRKRLREESEDDTVESQPVKINRVGDAVEEVVAPAEEQEEERAPAEDEVETAVAPEVAAQEEAPEEEVELPEMVEAEPMDSELTGKLLEKTETSKALGDATGVLENGPLVKDHDDLVMLEEATKDATENRETLVSAPEEAEEKTTQAEEELLSPVEREVPLKAQEEVAKEEATAPAVKEALSPAEEETSLCGEVELVDKAPAPAEKASPLTGTEETREEVSEKENSLEPEVPVEATTVTDVVLPKEQEAMEEEEGGPGEVSIVEENSASHSIAVVEVEKEGTTQVPVEQDREQFVDLTELSNKLPAEDRNDHELAEKLEEKILENEDDALIDVEKITEEDQKDMTADNNEVEKDIEVVKGEEEEKATSTEEEGEAAEKSSELSETNEPPVLDVRVLRKKTKVIRATNKRKSKQANRKLQDDGADQVETSERSEEEKGEDVLEEPRGIIEVKDAGKRQEEEEKATTTEEEAVEKSSDEGDEPPVVDFRVLRKKTKGIQSTPKPKSNRRSKT